MAKSLIGWYASLPTKKKNYAPEFVRKFKTIKDLLMKI